MEDRIHCISGLRWQTSHVNLTLTAYPKCKVVAVLACLLFVAFVASSPAQQESKASRDSTTMQTNTKTETQDTGKRETAKQIDDKVDVQLEIQRATAYLNQQQKYLLRYKFAKGETMVYQVEDRFTQKTSMNNIADSVSSRTQSVKKYAVKAVDTLDQMTFVQILEKTKSWTQINDKEPVEFDSQSKATPPAEYVKIANMIGVPQLTYTMSPTGKVSEKRAHFTDWNLGTGGAFIPFPNEPISIGFKWFVYRNTKARHENKRYEHIRLRNVFELVKVINGQAWIRCKTELLTPTDPVLKSQILQHLTSGYRVFDIENGRFTKMEIEWNETVHEFNGSDSIIEYVRKYSESLVDEAETAVSTLEANAPRSANKIELRTRYGRAIMRK